jgi:hypothetical protein
MFDVGATVVIGSERYIIPIRSTYVASIVI